MNEKSGESDIDALNRAVEEVMSRKLTKEELKGFGREKPKMPDVYPFVKVAFPSKEDGPKGYSVTVGVKGTF